MRRMIDDKKLKELEANGGTKWYKHEVRLENHVYILFYSMFGDPLKDIQLTVGNYPAIVTSASGPSAPNIDNFFPFIKIYVNGRFMINYLGSDGKFKQYEFNKSSISSDVVTQL